MDYPKHDLKDIAEAVYNLKMALGIYSDEAEPVIEIRLSKRCFQAIKSDANLYENRFHIDLSQANIPKTICGVKIKEGGE